MRKYSKLNETDRYFVQNGIERRLSARAIARSINRDPSTVIREIERNGGRLKYYKTSAQKESIRSNRKGYSKIEENEKMRWYIIKKLKEKWSPSVIAGRWKLENPKEETISSETIYAWLHSDKTKDLKLYQYLARMRKARGMRKHRLNKKTDNKISVHVRPDEINERRDTGHFEGDLVFQRGNGSQNFLTIIDRKTRFAQIIKCESKHAMTVSKQIRKALSHPLCSAKSLTFDNGSEFSKHKELGVPTYFCDPASPWQKGSIEHFNGILRRYLDFRVPIETVTQEMLDSIARNINNVPRKILGFLTPFEVMKKCYNQKSEGVASHS